MTNFQRLIVDIEANSQALQVLAERIAREKRNYLQTSDRFTALDYLEYSHSKLVNRISEELISLKALSGSITGDWR